MYFTLPPSRVYEQAGFPHPPRLPTYAKGTFVGAGNSPVVSCDIYIFTNKEKFHFFNEGPFGGILLVIDRFSVRLLTKS